MEENQRALTISEWRQVMKIQNDEPVSVNIEVPAYRLRNAEQILAQLGLNPNQAINLFLAKVELCQGLPFDVALEDSALLTPSQQADEWRGAFGEY